MIQAKLRRPATRQPSSGEAIGAALLASAAALKEAGAGAAGVDAAEASVFRRESSSQGREGELSKTRSNPTMKKMRRRRMRMSAAGAKKMKMMKMKIVAKMMRSKTKMKKRLTLNRIKSLQAKKRLLLTREAKSWSLLAQVDCLGEEKLRLELEPLLKSRKRLVPRALSPRGLRREEG